MNISYQGNCVPICHRSKKVFTKNSTAEYILIHTPSIQSNGVLYEVNKISLNTYIPHTLGKGFIDFDINDNAYFNHNNEIQAWQLTNSRMEFTVLDSHWDTSGYMEVIDENLTNLNIIDATILAGELITDNTISHEVFQYNPADKQLEPIVSYAATRLYDDFTKRNNYTYLTLQDQDTLSFDLDKGQQIKYKQLRLAYYDKEQFMESMYDSNFLSKIYKIKFYGPHSFQVYIQNELSLKPNVSSLMNHFV